MENPEKDPMMVVKEEMMKMGQKLEEMGQEKKMNQIMLSPKEKMEGNKQKKIIMILILKKVKQI